MFFIKLILYMFSIAYVILVVLFALALGYALLETAKDFVKPRAKPIVKQLFCNHIWKPFEETNNYLDTDDDKLIVHVYNCQCEKCGKVKKIKSYELYHGYSK